MTYWGSPWIAHPIVSFDFGDEGRVAISVETRKQVGESYSAIRGFFRYYELIYTIADERDVVRLQMRREGSGRALAKRRRSGKRVELDFRGGVAGGSCSDSSFKQES